MSKQSAMGMTTSASEVTSTRAARPAVRVATALEVLLVYAGILLYIWRWQFTHPRVWMVLLAVILLSHLVHRDTLRGLGLAWANLRASAQTVLPLALMIFIPFVVYGFWRHTLALLPPGRYTLRALALYGAWCVVQQYLTQSYFHGRLMSLIANRHLSSLVVAIMFGGAHVPNPILMVVTTLGGFILAEAFARHRNIWPLALAQVAGGFLVAALSPADLIRNMRVGPPYLFYEVP